MQHIDETQLPTTYGNQKTISDEVTIEDNDSTEDNNNNIIIPDSTDVDLPPESFWLSKDAEFDWFDRNAFLDRKDSTRGSFNAIVTNPSYSNSSSQRYSIKSKAGIIGLPKTQKTSYVDSKRRLCNKPVNVRLFPTRSYSVGKGKAPVMEPSSPKVSCIGRVRSKRCRSRRKPAGSGTEPVRSTSQRSGTGRVHKSGLLSRITALFRTDGNRRRRNGKKSKNGELTENVNVLRENSVKRKICVSVEPVSSEPATPNGPAGLGSMIRFASGHRSGFDVAGCDSLDFEVTSKM